MNISIILNNIQDPRRNHLQKHSLETIIYITLAAVIGGAESWYEIEEFGNTHIDFFKSKIEGLEEIPGLTHYSMASIWQGKNCPIPLSFFLLSCCP